MNKNKKVSILSKLAKAVACLVSASLITSCGGGSEDRDLSENQHLQPKLVIGLELYAPYEFLDANGELTGIDYDLAVEACRRLGYTPVFKIIKWENRNDYLENAEVDALWCCFSMDGREQDYTWAGPYLDSRYTFLVRKGSGINSLADLTDRVVCLQAGTRTVSLMSAPDAPKTKELLEFPYLESAYAAFKQRACDAITSHETRLAMLSQNSAEEKLLDEYLETVGLGVAFHKNGNRVMAEALTRTLKTMTDDGFIQRTVEKYGIRYAAPTKTSIQ